MRYALQVDGTSDRFDDVHHLPFNGREAMEQYMEENGYPLAHYCCPKCGVRLGQRYNGELNPEYWARVFDCDNTACAPEVLSPGMFGSCLYLLEEGELRPLTDDECFTQMVASPPLPGSAKEGHPDAR